MKNIEDINKAAIKKIVANKKITDFSPGDTIKVGVKIVEGKRERIQFFEGVCIAKKNAGLNSSFTVRKISYGEGIERVLPLFSPQIDKIELVKSGSVRRSKLYYLRERSGKSARIAEKNIFNKIDNEDVKVKKQEQLNTNLQNKSDETKNNQTKETSASKKSKNEETNTSEKVSQSMPEDQKT